MLICNINVDNVIANIELRKVLDAGDESGFLLKLLWEIPGNTDDKASIYAGTAFPSSWMTILTYRNTNTGIQTFGEIQNVCSVNEDRNKVNLKSGRFE